MDIKKYIINTDQQDFIKQLNKEINIHAKINKNPKLFIQHKNLKLHKFNKAPKYITEDDLPIQTILGSSYLIKGSNILEIYSWCDKAHSLHLQCSIYKPAWLGQIHIINKELHDPEKLEYILDGCDSFQDSTDLQYFIISFIKEGFSIYT